MPNTRVFYFKRPGCICVKDPGLSNRNTRVFFFSAWPRDHAWPNSRWPRACSSLSIVNTEDPRGREAKIDIFSV